jgi:hypothetical protein
MGGYAWLSWGLSVLVHLLVMVVIFRNVGATFNVASTCSFVGSTCQWGYVNQSVGHPCIRQWTWHRSFVFSNTIFFKSIYILNVVVLHILSGGGLLTSHYASHRPSQFVVDFMLSNDPNSSLLNMFPILINTFVGVHFSNIFQVSWVLLTIGSLFIVNGFQLCLRLGDFPQKMWPKRISYVLTFVW